MKDRRTAITIETYEILVMTHSIISRSCCESCGKEITVINLSDGSLCGLSEEVVGGTSEKLAVPFSSSRPTIRGLP